MDRYHYDVLAAEKLVQEFIEACVDAKRLSSCLHRRGFASALADGVVVGVVVDAEKRKDIEEAANNAKLQITLCDDTQRKLDVITDFLGYERINVVEACVCIKNNDLRRLMPGVIWVSNSMLAHISIDQYDHMRNVFGWLDKEIDHYAYSVLRAWGTARLM